MKVTVVGAGAVGATCADNIARKELCEELGIAGYQRRRGRRKSIGYDANCRTAWL